MVDLREEAVADAAGDAAAAEGEVVVEAAAATKRLE